MSNKDFEQNDDNVNSEGMSPDQVDEEIHSETLEGKKRKPQHLIINKESGKVINAETGEEVQSIDIVTEDGMLGSVSSSGRIVLCGANAYEEKYYFNPLFRKVPESIQKELYVLLKKKYSRTEKLVQGEMPSFLQMKGILKGEGNEETDGNMLDEYFLEKYNV